MKELKYISLLCAVAVALSCEENVIPAGGPAAFGIKAFGDTEFHSVTKNSTKTIDFAATTSDVGVSEQLTVTFKADSSLVSKFNQMVDTANAKMFPLEAYAFTKNNSLVYRYNRQSTVASLDVSYLSTMEANQNYVLPVVIGNITGSDNVSTDPQGVMYVFLNTSDVDKGAGTKDNPFRIYTLEDFVEMGSMIRKVDTPEAEPTYFILENDIDLKDQYWVPFNQSDPYNKKINFNGNHKTIKNLNCEGETYNSLFGVVFGEVYNFTLADSRVKTVAKSAGLVGSYCGSGDKKGIIHDVNVVNCVLDGSEGVDTGTGGLVGKAPNAEIYNCSVDVKIDFPKNYCGMVAGYMETNASIHDCIAKGTITAVGGAQRFGGIVGGMIRVGGSVTNCISLTEITVGICGGGIVGHANKDASSAQSKLGNVVRNCIAWNPKIEAKGQRRDQYSSGGVVGYTATDNILQDCYRRPDMVFIQNQDYEDGNAKYPKNYIVLEDQPNADEEHPLSVPGDHSTSHEFYWHGKAAAAGETASDVARKLGWNESIWDLSGDIPALKNL